MFILDVLDVDSNYQSVFSKVNIPVSSRGGMMLTEQISAQNFRLRKSAPGYKSDWHVAGDSTLIIVQQGSLRISLRNGVAKTFSAGDMFIARDKLPEGLKFDSLQHGHCAEVLGETELSAVHIKLKQSSFQL